MDSGAKEVHRDDFGILYVQPIKNDEPLVMVKVVNSTPESTGSLTRDEALLEFSPQSPVCHDGMMIPLSQVPSCLRFKSYFVRVPPSIKKAKEGVAWSFGKQEKDYDPAFQS